MTIQYAILGLLHQQPQSGYDLKKAFASSGFLPWSGNSNQIYTALLQLQAAGRVTSDSAPSAGYPTRKVYRLTPAGLADLHQWLLSPPALPECKNHFLIQLLLSDLLSPTELLALLNHYQGELEQSLLMHQEQARRAAALPSAQPHPVRMQVWAIQNLIDHTAAELDWLTRLRQSILE